MSEEFIKQANMGKKKKKLINRGEKNTFMS